MAQLSSFIEDSAEYFLDYGIWGLILISFMESSFFPIPPDVVLIPLAILNPGMALWYSLATTMASVVGGIFGYYIGCKAGRPLLHKYISREKLANIDRLLGKYGGWAVAIAGFTPIPYKVFTIASGVSRINMLTFITASFLGRGARFFLEGIIILTLGEKAGRFLDKYMETGTIIISFVLLSGFLAFKYRHSLRFRRKGGSIIMKNKVKHILILAAGWLFMILGIAGLFLPFLQGILFLLIGLSLLSHEYHWARAVFNTIKKRYPRIFDKFNKIKENPRNAYSIIFGAKKNVDRN